MNGSAVITNNGSNVIINTQPITQLILRKCAAECKCNRCNGIPVVPRHNKYRMVPMLQLIQRQLPESYTVVVSGTCGAPVTSNPAVLTTPVPVSITTQPQSQTFTGSNVLSVVASNATGYQWYLGGNPITGANNPSYTATAAGTYKVVVSGMCSSQVTSSDAILSTCPAVTINTPAIDPVILWQRSTQCERQQCYRISMAERFKQHYRS